MAGSFGYEKEHYDEIKNIVEKNLKNDNKKGSYEDKLEKLRKLYTDLRKKFLERV